MNDEIYILNISANKTCKRTARLFMVDFLQNALHEGKAMIVKVN